MPELEPSKKKPTPAWVDFLMVVVALAAIFAGIWYVTPKDPFERDVEIPIPQKPHYTVGPRHTLNPAGKKKFIEVIQETDPDKRQLLEAELSDPKYEDTSPQSDAGAEEFRKSAEDLLNDDDSDKRDKIEKKMAQPNNTDSKY
jgi:hypothetical protein